MTSSATPPSSCRRQLHLVLLVLLLVHAAPLAPRLPLPMIQSRMTLVGAVGHGAAGSWFSRSPARGHLRHHREPARTPAGFASHHQSPEQPRIRTISSASASRISNHVSVSVKDVIKLLRALLFFNLARVLLFPTSNASSASWFHAARLPRRHVTMPYSLALPTTASSRYRAPLKILSVDEHVRERASASIPAKNHLDALPARAHPSTSTTT
jgi:hypothetical protein